MEKIEIAHTHLYIIEDRDEWTEITSKHRGDDVPEMIGFYEGPGIYSINPFIHEYGVISKKMFRDDLDKLGTEIVTFLNECLEYLEDLEES